MKLPKMIMFDYVHTLVDEKAYDVLSGMISVLKYAVKNPYDVKADELANFSSEIFAEIIENKSLSSLEVHNFSFQNYVYEYYGLEFDKSSEEIERIFENASSKASPTKNIESLLVFLRKKGIRTGVISNMCFSGSMLKERINNYLPDHSFEFILASSEYVYSKPDKRIFELALRKAKLKADEVWFCGDNVKCDIEGAENSGIYPVWYKGSPGLVEEDKAKEGCLEIDDWTQLIDMIKSR